MKTLAYKIDKSLLNQPLNDPNPPLTPLPQISKTHKTELLKIEFSTSLSPPSNYDNIEMAYIF